MSHSTIYNFAVIYPGKFLFTLKVASFLPVLFFLEFAKLRAFRAFVPYLPSRLMGLDLYTPSAPYLLTRPFTQAHLNVTKSLIKDNFKMF